jgi:E3 ubiquitin-protein ligase RNF38/44
MADFGEPLQRNPTVIDTRLSELYAARATVLAVLGTNLPQILATIIVLAIHWNDVDVCTPEFSNKWKVWSIVSGVRMVLYCSMIVYIHVYKIWLEERPPLLHKTLALRNFLDAVGLVWFIVGNLWLFGDDSELCTAPEKSPIYILCYSLLVIAYLQICLPCILVVLFLPVLCFCMPCLIRILARLQDLQSTTKGANDAAIDSLQSLTISSEQLRTVDNNTCPICINEMVEGEQARSLPCKHLFHQSCVDEWLRVNASCPTCRASIYRLGSSAEDSGSADVVAAARGYSLPMEVRTNPTSGRATNASQYSSWATLIDNP